MSFLFVLLLLGLFLLVLRRQLGIFLLVLRRQLGLELLLRGLPPRGGPGERAARLLQLLPRVLLLGARAAGLLPQRGEV